MKYEVCGLGNALVDALVVMDERELIARHDVERGTMLLVDNDRWSGIYEEINDQHVEFHAGGSACNSVSTFASLGGSSTFIALVGSDHFGEVYQDRLTDVLGEHHVAVRTGGATGKCLSVVSSEDAERTMLTDLGVSIDLADGDISWDAVAASGWLHVTGYVLTGGQVAKTAMKVLDHARANGTRISFDVGDVFVLEHFGKAARTVIADYADVVFVNEEEARRFCECEDAKHALQRLAGLCDVAVVKLGKRGSMVQRGDDRVDVQAVLTDAIDTTGAGDSYAGGFLYGLCRDWPLQACGDLAASVASLTVAQVGAVVRDKELLRSRLPQQV